MRACDSSTTSRDGDPLSVSEWWASCLRVSYCQVPLKCTGCKYFGKRVGTWQTWDVNGTGQTFNCWLPNRRSLTLEAHSRAIFAGTREKDFKTDTIWAARLFPERRRWLKTLLTKRTAATARVNPSTRLRTGRGVRTSVLRWDDTPPDRITDLTIWSSALYPSTEVMH